MLKTATIPAPLAVYSNGHVSFWKSLVIKLFCCFSEDVFQYPLAATAAWLLYLIVLFHHMVKIRDRLSSWLHFERVKNDLQHEKLVSQHVTDTTKLNHARLRMLSPVSGVLRFVRVHQNVFVRRNELFNCLQDRAAKIAPQWTFLHMKIYWDKKKIQ